MVYLVHLDFLEVDLLVEYFLYHLKLIVLQQLLLLILLDQLGQVV
jgi:hypothetical protein